MCKFTCTSRRDAEWWLLFSSRTTDSCFFGGFFKGSLCFAQENLSRVRVDPLWLRAGLFNTNKLYNMSVFVSLIAYIWGKYPSEMHIVVCVCVCVTCLSSPPLITHHTCGNGLPKEKLKSQGWRDINEPQVLSAGLFVCTCRQKSTPPIQQCVRACVSSRISYSKTLHSLKSVKHLFFYFVTVWKWGVIEPKMTTNLFWSVMEHRKLRQSPGLNLVTYIQCFITSSKLL